MSSRLNSEDAEQLFTVFYRTHYIPALSLTEWRAAGSDAEAIVGEAFLAAWLHLQKVEELSRAWFYQTLRNKIGEYYRASKNAPLPMPSMDPFEGVFTAPDYEQPLVERMAVFEVLSRLPVIQAEPLALVYGCDLSTVEAAEVLGISPAAFRKRLERGRIAFRDEMLSMQIEPAEEDRE